VCYDIYKKKFILQYAVWVAAGILVVMTLVWIVLGLSTCCVACSKTTTENAAGTRRNDRELRRDGGRRGNERQALLQSN